MVKRWKNVFEKDDVYFRRVDIRFLLTSGVDVSHAYEIRGELLELKGWSGRALGQLVVPASDVRMSRRLESGN